VVQILFCLFSVLWKPIFKNHPLSTSAYLSVSVAAVTLSCEADGFPLPVISWLKNNSSIINSAVIQNGSFSTLLLVLMKINQHVCQGNGK